MMTKEKVYRPPTPAQRAATARNWRIRCLRALFGSAELLSPGAKAVVQHVINMELESKGARPSESPSFEATAAETRPILTSLMQRFL